MATETDIESLNVLTDLGETNLERRTAARATLAHRLDKLKTLEESNTHFGLFVVRTKRRVEDDEAGSLFYVTGEIAIQRPSDARWLKTQIGNAFVDEKSYNSLVPGTPYHMFLNLEKVEL